MVLGVAEDIRLTFEVKARRVRPGHKLRLAISTTYCPIILLLSADVSATPSLGTAALHFPSAPWREVAPSKPKPDRWPAFPASVAQQRANGVTEVVIDGKSRWAEHPDYGMIWRDLRRYSELPRGGGLHNREDTCEKC